MLGLCIGLLVLLFYQSEYLENALKKESGEPRPKIKQISSKEILEKLSWQRRREPEFDDSARPDAEFSVFDLTPQMKYETGNSM